MKRFFIVEINEDGRSLGIATNNLHRDFIERFKIEWHQSKGGKIFGPPVIEDLTVGRTNLVVYIYDMSEVQATGNIDYKPCIGEFNFFTENYYDDVTDFITDNWRTIITKMDESESLKKFKDFN